MRAPSPIPSVAPLSTCKRQLAGTRGWEDCQEGPGLADGFPWPPGPLRFWYAVATTGRWTGGAWGP